MGIKEEKTIDYLYEVLNSLEDDLEIDEIGENGYKNFCESWKAIHKFTLPRLREMINELEVSQKE